MVTLVSTSCIFVMFFHDYYMWYFTRTHNNVFAVSFFIFVLRNKQYVVYNFFGGVFRSFFYPFIPVSTLLFFYNLSVTTFHCVVSCVIIGPWIFLYISPEEVLLEVSYLVKIFVLCYIWVVPVPVVFWPVPIFPASCVGTLVFCFWIFFPPFDYLVPIIHSFGYNLLRICHGSFW